MRHKRALLAVLIIALTGAFLIPSAPVMAQGTWTCTFDFTQSAGTGWVPRIFNSPSWGSYYVPGAGWRNTSTYYSNSISLPITVSGSILQGVSFDFYGGNPTVERAFIALQNAFMGFLINYGEFQPPPDTVTWTGSQQLHKDDDELIIGVGGHGSNEVLRVSTITKATLWGTGTPPCTPDATPEYESTPEAGGTVSVGAGEVGTQIVNSSAMQISNTGEATLLTGFEISGDNAANFEMITDSPLGVVPGGSASVVIACTPPNFGATTATLTVTTNDADEETNTYTLSCTGDPPSGADVPNLGTCLAMGQAATFAAGWTTLGGAGNPPGTQRGMMLPPGSEASYSLSLQPTWQYAMTVKYRSTTPQEGQTFRLRLGAHPGFDVPVVNDTDLHTYEVPGGNYRPDQFGGYTLRLNGPTSDTGLIVDYVCVTQRQIAGAAPGQGGGGIGGVDATCEACVYEPASREIDVFGLAVSVPDLSAIIDWLFCGLRRVIECELLPAIQGIWSMVTDTVKFLSSFRGLFDGVVTLVGDATVGNLGALGEFGGAHMNNVGGLVGNAFYDAGLADAQNQIVGGVNNVAPSVANALGGMNGSAAAASSPTASADALADPLGGIITAFGYLFTMAPQFIGSMIDGLNTSAYVPVSGSITCSNPGVILYYPCLGFYVADNTIFQGPAMYLIPILMAVLAWDTLTWAIAKFKEAFSR